MKYCLRCRKDVTGDGYNPSYYGMGGEAIHYGRDWYCGPVITCEFEPDRKTASRLWRNYTARERYSWRKRQIAEVVKELYT
jgi:hypothetical protein